MTSAAIYRAIMMAFEAQRAALGWSMAQVDDRAGTQDGYYAKMIYPDTPSGRQATWPMVDMVVQALFGRDFGLSLTAGNALMLNAFGIANDTNEKARQHRHWRHTQHYRMLGKKSAAGRLSKMSAADRAAVARNAAKIRWRKQRQARRAQRNAKRKA